MNAVEVQHLLVTYADTIALQEVNFKVPTGVLSAIIGPNGAGKSTLIKAIMEILPSRMGQVKLLGKDLKDVRKKVSYVPQRESVDWSFPISVLEVVLMGTYSSWSLFGGYTKEQKEHAHWALEKMGMAPYAKRQISELSGGQQQRVFLARALAQKADLYFLDEPFAGVDAATEKAVIQLLTEIKNSGKTILVVHHDLQTVREYFDWVVLVNKTVLVSDRTENAFTPENLEKAYQGKLKMG